MSVAIIYTDRSTTGSWTSPVELHTLGQLAWDPDRIVVEFNTASSASNPNTFTLAAGVYRVDGVYCGFQQYDNTGTLTHSSPVALYDRTVSVVRGLFQPKYMRTVVSGATFRELTQVVYKMRTRFEIRQGTRVFALNQIFPGTTPASLAFYEDGNHTVTATLGGSALPKRYIQLKITKTS